MINKRVIHRSLIVPATTQTLWKKWTTHDGLKSWFGVDNRIELRPGGPYEIYFLMDNPSGLRGGEGNQVLSYLPQQMLSFSWNAPPSIPEIRDHEHRTWVVVHFKRVGSKQTEVTLDHLGWLDGEKWDEAFNYFESAWDTVLSWLAQSCRNEDK